MAKYLPAQHLPEDKRIILIGQTCMKLEPGHTNAFIVNYEGGTKADRYIKKLLDRFPQLEVKKRFIGPIIGAETVIIRRKSDLA